MIDRFPHIAQRLFNVPLAITPDKAEVIMTALARHVGFPLALFRDGDAVIPDRGAFYLDDDDAGVRRDPYAERGYDLVGGIAVIPVTGTLVQKLGTLRPYSGMTGYDGIRQNFFTALTDDAVRAIVFDIDSPGGECAGCFDLTDAIYNARGEKRIWSILDENACSAAYAIASAADHVTMPRSGIAGSIGVIVMLTDISKALSATGIQVTTVTYGARKADYHPEVPLAPEALERLQVQIDDLGELFVETVARNRGIDANAVRATEAAIFQGRQAIDVRLVDQIAAPDAAFRALLSQLA